MNQYLKIDYELLTHISSHDLWDIYPLYCVLLQHIDYSGQNWKNGQLTTLIGRPKLCSKLHIHPKKLTRLLTKLYGMQWIKPDKRFGKCNHYILGENKELFSSIEVKKYAKLDPGKKNTHPDLKLTNAKLDPGTEKDHQDLECPKVDENDILPGSEMSKCIQTGQNGSTIYNKKDNYISSYLPREDSEDRTSQNQPKKETIIKKELCKKSGPKPAYDSSQSYRRKGAIISGNTYTPAFDPVKGCYVNNLRNAAPCQKVEPVIEKIEIKKDNVYSEEAVWEAFVAELDSIP